MIRAGLPLPPALRMRLRMDAAAEGIAQKIRTVRRRFVSVARSRSEMDGQNDRVRSESLEILEVRSMQEFVSRYDDLVDLLCWTAKEGPSDMRRARYSELRSWFVQNYEPVRPRVLRYLDTLPDDREPVASGTEHPRDAFESLFLPHHIDSLIHSDAVIHRIMRTRCAVEAFREELERDCVHAE